VTGVPSLGGAAARDEQAVQGGLDKQGALDKHSALDEADVLLALDAGSAREVMAVAAKRYGAALGRLCMAMVGSQAVAEELAQETFLIAFGSLGTWRRESTLRAWLFGIARKKCLKHLETHRRQAGKLYLIKTEESAAGVDELLIRRLEAERARAALHDVPPTEREAVILRFAGELSFEEVAAISGIEEPAARKRVSRGVAKLREILKETRER
jgi:RNA polymerase sigma-70 factor, ECF subfamily